MTKIQPKYRIDWNNSVLFKTFACYRVVALRDFGDVKAGDRGGYVSNGRILSHEGDCWIGEEAAALGTVTVSGNARLEGWAAIWDDVELSGNARVYGLASLWGNTRVFENGQVSGRRRLGRATSGARRISPGTRASHTGSR